MTSEDNQNSDPSKNPNAADIGMSLKDQLDAIKTPDVIANPGGGGAPTPRNTGTNLGGMSGAGGSEYDLANHVSPSAPTQPAADAPAWMKQFAQHQNDYLNTVHNQGGAQSNPYSTSSGYSSNSSSPAPAANYTIVIALVIIAVIALVGFVTMNKPAVIPTTTTTTTETTTSLPGTPGGATGPGPAVNPYAQPGQPQQVMPGQPNPYGQQPQYNQANPYGQPGQNQIQPGYPNPAPGVNPMPGQLSPNPVPGAAPLSPNPVPDANPTLTPNPVPGAQPSMQPGLQPGLQPGMQPGTQPGGIYPQQGNNP